MGGIFKLMQRRIECLKEANIAFNVLTAIHENNVSKAKELMDFYQEEGSSSFLVWLSNRKISANLELIRKGNRLLGRNDPCICGSRKKH